MRLDEQANGNKILTGMLGCALEAGAILVMRKVDDDYCLIAASGDGRRPNYSQQTLGAFVDTEVPCSWCPGKPDKNRAVWIVGAEKQLFLCVECAEFEQFKKYKSRTRVVGT